MRKKKQVDLISRNYSAWFLVPGMTMFIVFFIFPFFIALYYSFTNWNFTKAEFVGLTNYINVITNDEMNIAFKNTFIFTILTTLFKTLFGLALAVFVNGKLRTKNYLRGAFFMPVVINTIAVGIVFTALMHPTKGLINRGFTAIGLDALAMNWLTDKTLAIYSVCAVEIWKWTGFTMVLLIAGLQMISTEYYEAASIDGASKWQQFKNITLPLLRPSLVNSIILSVIGGLKVFDMVLATTGGGPGSATQVFNTVIFRSFAFNMQGEACAGNVVLSVLIMAIVLVTYRIIAGEEVEV